MSTDIENEIEKLNLQVKVEKPSACERHVVVTVPRQDIDRYFKKAFDDLGPKAEMPGFRVGKAPRKLVESRFKAQITDQVKSSITLDALQQITEGQDFSAISEPDMDFGAVEIPPEGDFTFEFKIEVRPEFDTPNWKGLSLVRPTFEITDKVVEEQLGNTLMKMSPGVAVDEPAKMGDVLVLTMTFSSEGKEISVLEEESIVLRKRLSLSDAILENFGDLLVGAKEGEERTTTVNLSSSAGPEWAEKPVDVSIKVVEVRRIVLEELRDGVLDQLGFQDPTELKEFVREELEKQRDYFQQRELRKQITTELTKEANWELPEALVNRQTTRELQRQYLELQRSGMDADMINRILNANRRNAQESTIEALREHFVLEKIAEDLSIEPTAEEYDEEIEAIALNTDSNPRKVRARLEKTGQMDALRNQILERKVIATIVEQSKVEEKENGSFLKDAPEETAVDFNIVDYDAQIPEAKYNSQATDGQTEGSTVKLQP